MSNPYKRQTNIKKSPIATTKTTQQTRSIGKKKALLIGINDYPSPSQLHGCVNDSYTMKALLIQKYGFPQDEITMLLDHDATTSEIINQMQLLAQGASKDDLLVFAYSGHGSQVDDPNPLADNGKEDIICPIDLKWDEPVTGHIIRDCLKPASDAGAIVVMLMDCCHSGHVDRTFNPNGSIRSKYLPPPTGLRTCDTGNTLAFQLANSCQTKSRGVDQPANIFVLISGCQDAETSADANFGGVSHGAFTYFLEQTLRENAYDISYENLHQSIWNRLKDAGFSQNPNFIAPDEYKGKNFLNGVTTTRGVVREQLDQPQFERLVTKVKDGDFNLGSLTKFPRPKDIGNHFKGRDIFQSVTTKVQSLIHDLDTQVKGIKNLDDLNNFLDEFNGKLGEHLEDLTDQLVTRAANCTPDERYVLLSDLRDYVEVTGGVSKDIGSFLTGLASNVASLGVNAVAPGLGPVAGAAVQSLGGLISGLF